MKAGVQVGPELDRVYARGLVEAVIGCWDLADSRALGADSPGRDGATIVSHGDVAHDLGRIDSHRRASPVRARVGSRRIIIN